MALCEDVCQVIRENRRAAPLGNLAPCQPHPSAGAITWVRPTHYRQERSAGKPPSPSSPICVGAKQKCPLHRPSSLPARSYQRGHDDHRQSLDASGSQLQVEESVNALTQNLGHSTR